MMPPPSATSTPVTPQIPIDESGEINTDVLEAEAARLAAEDGEYRYIVYIGCQYLSPSPVCSIVKCSSCLQLDVFGPPVYLHLHS